MARKLLKTLSVIPFLLFLVYLSVYHQIPTSSFPDFSRRILQTNTGDSAALRSAFATGNIPIIYFKKNQKFPKNYNSTCAKFPSIYEMKFKNTHWQVLPTSNGTLHLFNAYVDDRVQNETSVRIMAMYDRYQPKDQFYCQFWFEGVDKPAIVKSAELFWLFRAKWGADRDKINQPYIVTCPLPNKGQIPMSVSLVEKLCDNPSNNLRVFHETIERKKNFVVCVKGLDFPFEDNSPRLAEWIELLHILGAEKINFYAFSLHPATQKLLDFYVDQGKVEVTPLSLAGDISNLPLLQHKFLKEKTIERRLQEVIPYNDCLYKHLNQFKYVVLLDTDEVIVPVRNTWVELIADMRRTFGERSSYVARNVYFLDSHNHGHKWFEGIPRYMHMLQHVFRAMNYTKPGFFVKGFHNTERVLALHNHFPFQCLGGCSVNEINVTLGHLQHYRSTCVKGVGDCVAMKLNSVVDARLWNYKDELVERVKRVLSYLGIEPS